jgi:hypothetical protein
MRDPESNRESCRGRVRTSTEKLAKKQSLVVNPGRLNPDFHRENVGSTFRLSFYLHPRDEGVAAVDYDIYKNKKVPPEAGQTII